MRNIEWTARIAWGEARSEGAQGLQAVINVIDNRARMDLFNDNKPDWWGESHAGVATQPYQFSAYNENDPNRPQLEAVTDADPLFVEAVALAAKAVAGRLPDITGGATHYHTTTLTPPDWTVGAEPTAVIGNHIFYKGVA
jgi:spore germination cell wall hydrolase CwlJ-like protein